MRCALADDGQELMELCTSCFPVGTLVLPPTIVEANEQSRDHDQCGYPSPKTCSVELQPCSSSQLVNDLVVVGLVLVGCLICDGWGLATGASHVYAVDVLADSLARVIDRVMG